MRPLCETLTLCLQYWLFDYYYTNIQISFNCYDLIEIVGIRSVLSNVISYTGIIVSEEK